MKAYLEDREVEITKIEHGSDYCDSYIVEACFLDNGEDLTEEELNELTELYQDLLYESWIERKYSRDCDVD
jgi:hypothetical protein